MANPKIAIEAILADREREVGEYRLYPLTIGRYALLEAVGSPLTDPSAKFTMMNILPTLYVCMNDVQTLKKYGPGDVQKLREDAMAWGEENVKAEDASELVSKILEELLNVNKIIRPAYISVCQETPYVDLKDR